MKVNGNEVDVGGWLFGFTILIIASPVIGLLVWFWLLLACGVAWLFIGPVDYCVALFSR